MITPDGLAKSCRHSYPTNMRNYCGPKNAHVDFAEFAKHPLQEKAKKIMSQIRGFPILFSYYEALSKEFELKEFDEQIISHYWGGQSLGKVNTKIAQDFVLNTLTKKGLDKKRAQIISGQIKENISLDHAFHVLQVKFITNKVEKSLENFSNCLILPAEVIESNPGKIIAIDTRLDEKGKKFAHKKTVLENPFGLDLEKGELVSVHWLHAIEKISSAKAQELEKRILVYL